MPAFTLDALTGERVDLVQMRGRVVLVHFFATWCEPCRAELTSLQHLASRMRDKPFTVLAVDVGEAAASVRRFFAAEPVPFPILLDHDKAASKAWQVYVLPTTFLLNRDLTPHFVAEGDLDWTRPDVEEALAELMSSKTAVGELKPTFAPK